MTQTLQLDRDITRFIGDDTFPFKVTVCVGNERLVCSGIALAEQSHVLELKMRKDEGMLMFEEMVEAPGSAEILFQCVRYLHGAPLDLRFENLEVILKFSSWCKVSGLFALCVSWLKTELFLLEPVGVNLQRIMQLFKIANCLLQNESAVLKDLGHLLILFHRSEMFWIQMADYLDVGVNGYDIIKILENCTSGNTACFILRKWVSLSVDHRDFLLYNLSSFRVLFLNKEDFNDFIPTYNFS